MEGWWWVSFCVCVYVCACTGEWMRMWVSEGVSEWWCEWGGWVCVCVDHLHRCKTSFCLVDGFVLCLLDFELRLQGAQVWLWFLCQRRRPDVTVISKGDVPLTYLPTMFFHFPFWEEAQPKNLLVVHLKISIFCTVGAIWTFLVIYNWFCYIRTFLRART